MLQDAVVLVYLCWDTITTRALLNRVDGIEEDLLESK